MYAIRSYYETEFFRPLERTLGGLAGEKAALSNNSDPLNAHFLGNVKCTFLVVLGDGTGDTKDVFSSSLPDPRNNFV